MRRRQRKRSESGQATVEALLTFPMMLFMFLGGLQMFMLWQARILTEYAAYRAVRVGTTNHASCPHMLHAAIAALLPSMTAITTPAELTAALTGGNYLANQNPQGGKIVTIIKEQPTGAVLDGPQDLDFDLPFEPGTQPTRLEIRMVFWYPMRIPYANWVLSRIFLAHWQLQDYVAKNPYFLLKDANFGDTPNPLPAALAAVGAEFRTRVNAGDYVFPITATWGMRLMTPLKASTAATTCE